MTHSIFSNIPDPLSIRLHLEQWVQQRLPYSWIFLRYVSRIACSLRQHSTATRGESASADRAQLKADPHNTQSTSPCDDVPPVQDSTSDVEKNVTTVPLASVNLMLDAQHRTQWDGFVNNKEWARIRLWSGSATQSATLNEIVEAIVVLYVSHAQSPRDNDDDDSDSNNDANDGDDSNVRVPKVENAKLNPLADSDEDPNNNDGVDHHEPYNSKISALDDPASAYKVPPLPLSSTSKTAHSTFRQLKATISAQRLVGVVTRKHSIPDKQPPSPRTPRSESIAAGTSSPQQPQASQQHKSRVPHHETHRPHRPRYSQGVHVLKHRWLVSWSKSCSTQARDLALDPWLSRYKVEPVGAVAMLLDCEGSDHVPANPLAGLLHSPMPLCDTTTTAHLVQLYASLIPEPPFNRNIGYREVPPPATTAAPANQQQQRVYVESQIRAAWNREVLGCVSAAWEQALLVLPTKLPKSRWPDMYLFWPMMDTTAVQSTKAHNKMSRDLCNIVCLPVLERLPRYPLFLTLSKELKLAKDSFFSPESLQPVSKQFVSMHFDLLDVPSRVADSLAFGGLQGLRVFDAARLCAHIKKKVDADKVLTNKPKWIPLTIPETVSQLLAFAIADLGPNEAPKHLVGCRLVITTKGTLLPLGERELFVVPANQRLLFSGHGVEADLFAHEAFFNELWEKHLTHHVALRQKLRLMPLMPASLAQLYTRTSFCHQMLSPPLEWLVQFWAIAGPAVTDSIEQAAKTAFQQQQRQQPQRLRTQTRMQVLQHHFGPLCLLPMTNNTTTHVSAIEVSLLLRRTDLAALGMSVESTSALSSDTTTNTTTNTDTATTSRQSPHQLRQPLSFSHSNEPPPSPPSHTPVDDPIDSDITEAASMCTQVFHLNAIHPSCVDFIFPHLTSRDVLLSAVQALSVLNHRTSLQVEEDQSHKINGFLKACSQEWFYEDLQAMTNLKSLPFFRVLQAVANGEVRFTALHSGTEWFTTTSPDIIRTIVSQSNISNFIELPPDQALLQLFEHLGVNHLSDADLFDKFVLPNFAKLNPEEQLARLENIRQGWRTLRTKPSLVEKLRQIEFVSTSSGLDGPRIAPHRCLDPRSDVLKALFAGQALFPHGRFASTTGDQRNNAPSWLEMLEDLGLQKTVSRELFVECATEIHAHASAPSANHIARAKTLVAFMIANFTSLFSPSFCRSIQSLCFVPVDPEPMATLRRLASASSKSSSSSSSSFSDFAVGSLTLRPTPLSCFSMCALPDHKLLVMLACPLMDASAIPPRLAWDHLAIQGSPSLTRVVDNLKRMTQACILECWPLPDISPDDVYSKILGLLSESWDSVPNNLRQELRAVSIVPVGSAIVPASRLFLTLNSSEGLFPFMFELPARFVRFEGVLRDLGMEETPSAARLIELLNSLKREYGNRALNPNELRSFLRILNSLASSYSSSQSQLAVIPDTNAVLCSSRLCLLNDAPWLLEKIRPGSVHLAHPSLKQDMCLKLGVQMLSTALKEQLDPRDPAKPVASLADMAAQMSQIVVAANTIRIIASVWQQCDPAHALPEQNVHALLKDVTVSIVEHITTRLYLLSSGTDVTRAPTAASVASAVPSASSTPSSLFFVDAANKHILIAEPPLGVGCDYLLSVALSRFLGCAVVLPIAPFLNPASRQLQPDVAQALGLVQGDTESLVMRLSRRGVAGESLLESDISLVQLRPGRPLSKGEVIAWEDKSGPSPVFRYGAIDDIPSTNSGESSSRFIKKVRVIVDEGSGRTAYFMPSMLYTFGGHATGVSSEAASSGFEELAANPVTSAKTTTDPKKTQITTAGGEGNLDHVTGTDFVKAVEDLLTKANVPFGLDQKKVLEQNVNLQDRLRQAGEELSQTKSQLEKMNATSEKLKSELTCKICFTNEVNIVIVPCGHLICAECSRGTTQRCCPFCRTAVAQVCKFFKST